ncbi:protein delta homolog 1-like isoform X2 [Carassius auratus]|uniref:Protein delta homolog 1-like isoform X2 n=1 Tax=Carassius auratus TaxID=7957 RepID=A0A6P6N2E8_CARAU|nr:protein delta homolog 1-like isoform X2 [Carassius auratus]
MNVFLRLGFSFLLLFCAPVSAQEVHRCSSKLCSGNSTCVQTGRGGHVCLCSPGHTGENCQLKTGACSENGSRCQNGGSCVNTSGFDSRSSCLCAPGFTGSVCEKELDVCQPNPCVNGGRCVQRDPTYTCVCPPRFTGPSCELHVSQLKPKPRARALGPGHHTAAAHTFHKLLRPSEREPLQPSGPLVTRSQIICFSVLGLLTCLVILVTTGIVFFSRCETWMANTKYSQLVRQQRDQLLRASDLEQRSLNIILPENIRMSNYSRLYTSI